MNQDLRMRNLDIDAGPTISVVIPAFNSEGYISEAIRSILSGEYLPHEVIVVDDGSTDNTACTVEELRRGLKTAGRVRLIRQENLGVSSARNSGLDSVTGEYVVFLDSDDSLTAPTLATLAPLLADGPDMVYWRYRRVLGDGTQLSISPQNQWPPGPLDGWAVLSGKILSEGVDIWIGASAWRAGYLRQHGFMFQVGCATGEDTEFIWKALSRSHHVRFLNAGITNYQWRDASVSNVADVRRFDGCMSLFRVCDYIDGDDRDHATDIVASVRARAIDRYFWTLDHMSGSVVGDLARVVEQRVPGCTARVRRELIDQHRTGHWMGFRRLLFVAAPRVAVRHWGALRDLANHKWPWRRAGRAAAVRPD